MPYLMAGFPTLAESAQIGQACVQAGADLLELGVPYADPLADGPVIHAAGTKALQAGADMAGVLEVARTLASIAPSLPVIVSSGYISDELRAGAERFGVRAVMEKENTFDELPGLIGRVLSEAAH
jgi:tryptophan synthase alpha chain